MNERIKEELLNGCMKLDEIVKKDMNTSGFYCIVLKDSAKLYGSFKEIHISNPTNVVYIGIAPNTIRRRFWDNEINGRGHGTFFRSLGTVLGFMPERGSLRLHDNQNNYTFSSEDRSKITKWISDNLLVNFVPYISEDRKRFEKIERELIGEYKPLLNIVHNPNRSRRLEELREQCRKRAAE